MMSSTKQSSENHGTKASQSSFIGLVSEFLKSSTKKVIAYGISFLVLAYLVVLLYAFFFRGIEWLFADSFIISTLSVLFLALTADSFLLLLRLPRKPAIHENVSFDPSKVTVLIPTYKSAGVISKTIDNVLVHNIPRDQIFIISDKTPKPEQQEAVIDIAQSYGVRVFKNKVNMNKAMGINMVIKHVETPYTIILDDDTFIGKTFLPTSLLDEGYSAVAFDVMPSPTGSLINIFQVFEYRKSMYLAKCLQSSVAAIGNVSGALGLYQTKDLVYQATRHSGQPGGEDIQRTMLVHLEARGKGVVYMDSTVLTDAPEEWYTLYRQRATRWNAAWHETFVLALRTIISPKTHYLLKLERAYNLFIFLTEPLRMLLWVYVIFHLQALLILYIFFVGMGYLAWFKLGKKDPWWIPFAFPFYAKFNAFCRFVAHFYWFKLKSYYFKQRFYRLINSRKLMLEYIATMIVIVLVWPVSIYQFAQLGKTQDLYVQAKSGVSAIINTISAASAQRDVDTGAQLEIIGDSNFHDAETIEQSRDEVLVTVDSTNDRDVHYAARVHQNEGLTHVARSVIQKHLSANHLSQAYSFDEIVYAEDWLVKNILVDKNNAAVTVYANDIFYISEDEVQSSLLAVHEKKYR